MHKTDEKKRLNRKKKIECMCGTVAIVSAEDQTNVERRRRYYGLTERNDGQYRGKSREMIGNTTMKVYSKRPEERRTNEEKKESKKNDTA